MIPDHGEMPSSLYVVFWGDHDRKLTADMKNGLLTAPSDKPRLAKPLSVTTLFDAQ